MTKSAFVICEQQRRRIAVHPRSLISTFVVRCLDSMMDTYTCYIQIFKTLAGLCSWARWFESYLAASPLTWLITGINKLRIRKLKT